MEHKMKYAVCKDKIPKGSRCTLVYTTPEACTSYKEFLEKSTITHVAIFDDKNRLSYMNVQMASSIGLVEKMPENHPYDNCDETSANCSTCEKYRP